MVIGTIDRDELEAELEAEMAETSVRPITLEEAKHLRPGAVLLDLVANASNGNPRRWRVNGRAKLWKRSPNRVKVPIKWGLYTYGYLTEDNLHEFGVEE